MVRANRNPSNGVDAYRRSCCFCFIFSRLFCLYLLFNSKRCNEVSIRIFLLSSSAVFFDKYFFLFMFIYFICYGQCNVMMGRGSQQILQSHRSRICEFLSSQVFDIFFFHLSSFCLFSSRRKKLLPKRVGTIIFRMLQVIVMLCVGKFSPPKLSKTSSQYSMLEFVVIFFFLCVDVFLA